MRKRDVPGTGYEKQEGQDEGQIVSQCGWHIRDRKSKDGILDTWPRNSKSCLADGYHGQK